MDSLHEAPQYAPEFHQFNVGRGIVKLVLPPPFLRPQQDIVDRQLSFIQPRLTQWYGQLSREMCIEPSGELIFGGSGFGARALAPEKTQICGSSLVAKYGDMTAERIVLSDTVEVSALEIPHHLHWLKVAQRGEFDSIQTKVGLAISETVTGHPLMRKPLRVENVFTPPFNYALAETLLDADLRYLLITAIDTDRLAGEDDYEFARYYLPALGEKPWQRQDLINHTIKPNTASSESEIMQQVRQLARELHERNHQPVNPNDLQRFDLFGAKSEEDFIKRLRRVREAQYETVSPQVRQQLVDNDYKILTAVMNLRQEIQRRGLGIGSHVSQLSAFADHVFAWTRNQ